MTEFVVIDNGIETDWIDPLLSYEETPFSYQVDNGHWIYSIDKKRGREVVIREKE